MSTQGYEVGDMVFSRVDIHNDGSMPNVPPTELLSPAGSRGVIVRVGHAGAMPQQRIYLVRFESGLDRVLGAPVGCVDEDLTQDDSQWRALAAAGG
jgi:nitrogen fixation protein NifZ